MPVFQYNGVNSAGKSISGTMEAPSEQILQRRLKETGVWLMKAAAGSATTSTAKRLNRVRIKRWDLVTFLVQMSLLLRAGITLPVALRRLGSDYREIRLGAVINDVAEQVEQGVPLNQAMASYPKIFTPQMTAIIQAGEVSGTLPEVFDNLRAYVEWLNQLVADLRQALVYPLIVIAAASALVMILFTFVVPRFVGMLQALSLQVPPLTRAVIAISDSVRSYGGIALAAIICLPFALKMIGRFPKAGIWIDRHKLSLPLLGDLLRMFSLSRLSHNLSLLYRSGIPLLKALEICQGVVGNRAIAAALGKVRQGVAEGAPMSQTMSTLGLFPQTLITMIMTGETSGHLDQSLASLAHYYNEMIPRKTKALFSYFEPAIMIGLICVVGTVAVSIILPILKLWQLH